MKTITNQKSLVCELFEKFENCIRFDPLCAVLENVNRYLSTNEVVSFTVKLPFGGEIRIKEDECVALKDLSTYIQFSRNPIRYYEEYQDGYIENAFIRTDNSEPSVHDKSFDKYIEKLFGLKREESTDCYRIIN